ncbi:MAG: hypothetical protein P8R42_19750 [Candidatus Binatia bacterium]|nr:hypothetical protein [Candidatus Binatia bacterium]
MKTLNNQANERSWTQGFAAKALLGLAFVTMLGTGCRNFSLGGDMVADRHVLRGRSNPELTRAEIRAGTFESRNRQVRPLRNLLRNLGGQLSVKSALWPEANGDVEIYDPRNPDHRASGPEAFASVLGPASPLFAPIPLSTLEAEVAALCESPLLQGQLPDAVCGGFGLGALESVPFDDLHLRVDSNDIDVFWDGPRTNFHTYEFPSDTGSCSMEGDDVRANCSAGYDCPTDDAGEAVAGECRWNRLCSTNDDCRDRSFLEPGVCADTVGVCTSFNAFDSGNSEQDREAPVLVVELPIAGDLDPNDLLGAALDIGVNQLVFELRIQPVACSGAGCRFDRGLIFEDYRLGAPRDLAESGTGLDVHVRSRLVSTDISIAPGALCFLPALPVEVAILFPPLGAAGVPLATCIAAGEIARGMIHDRLASVGRMPGRILDGLMQIPLLNIPVSGGLTLDTSSIFAGDSLAPLAGPGGTWSTDTINLIHDGGGLKRAQLDLSVLNGTCQACPASRSLCSQCTTLCGGPAGLASCDLTSAGICVVPSGDSSHCEATDLQLTEGLLLVVYEVLRPLAPGADSAARRAHRLAREALWAMLSEEIPASPNLAAFFDGVLSAAPTVQEIFTRPLDAVDAEGRYRFTDTLWCAPSPTRPAACRAGERNAVFRFLPDRDLDGVPNEDDNCPADVNPEQVDNDLDGFGDGCDLCPWTPDPFNNPNNCQCDIDSDGCVNELGLRPVDHAPDSVPTSCTPRDGEIHDQRPTRSSGNTDEDGDGIPSDCDPDDDNDGVPDEDDNCPFDDNPDQRDQNDNGIGDACDLCNAGQPICLFDPNGPGGNFDPDFDFSNLPPPGFDPDFFRIFTRGCKDGSSCLGGRFNAQFGNRKFNVSPKDLGVGGIRSATMLPDLTGDGMPEVVFGLALGKQRGRVLVRDVVKGTTLWSRTRKKGDFGTAIVVDFVSERILVGAPNVVLKGKARKKSPSGAIYALDFKGRNIGEPFYGKPGDHLGTDLMSLVDGRIVGQVSDGALLLDLDSQTLLHEMALKGGRAKGRY